MYKIRYEGSLSKGTMISFNFIGIFADFIEEDDKCLS